MKKSAIVGASPEMTPAFTFQRLFRKEFSTMKKPLLLLSAACAFACLPGVSDAVFAQENDPPVAAAPAKAPEETIVLPAGTILELELTKSVNTKINEVNDQVSGILKESVRVNGKLVLPRGTEFRGRIAEISKAKSGQRVGTVKLSFDEVVADFGTQSVSTVVVSVDDLRHEARLKADDDGKLKAGRDGRRTANNTVTGGILGGLGASTVLLGGGGGGAAAGTLGGAAGAGALITKGNDINLDSGTLVRIKTLKDEKFPKL
jgi:hypothetical protein